MYHFMICMANSEIDVLYSNVNHIKDGIADLAAGMVGKYFFISRLNLFIYQEIYIIANFCCIFKLMPLSLFTCCD